MQVGRPELMMIAVLITDIPVDNTAVVRGSQDNVRFDGAGGINDQPGSEATIVSHRAPHYRAVGKIQLSVSIQGTQGSRDQIVIGKCGTCTDKCVSSYHAHLQAGILGDHAVVHDGGIEQGSPKREEGPIPYHR